jgi:hypothetical protein
MFYLLSKKTTKDQGTTGSVMGMNSPLVKINMQMIGYTVMMNILVFFGRSIFHSQIIITIDMIVLSISDSIYIYIYSK